LRWTASKHHEQVLWPLPELVMDILVHTLKGRRYPSSQRSFRPSQDKNRPLLFPSVLAHPLATSRVIPVALKRTNFSLSLECAPSLNHPLASTPDRYLFSHWFGQVSLSPTDSYISNNPFAWGLFIALMMETVRTSETSVYFNNTTRRHIPEGCHL
jgi:hypothetical protein